MNEPTKFDLAEAAMVPTQVSANMDPWLQLHVAQRQIGMIKAATASTAVDEIAVVARVKDLGDWEALSEVREPVLIGTRSSKDHVVTGRIPIRRVEAVRKQSFVKSLKAARTLQPTLNATIEETGARADLLPQGHLANGGAGVVVGVIDYGGDFAHDNFRNADGTTRLSRLWYQDGPTTVTSPFGYGKEFTSQDLNLALQQTDPYQAAGYDPGDFESVFSPGSHGTHVMDIAAGNGRGTGVSGMAPDADLIFVNISHAVDPQGAARVGESFGDSVRLLEGLKYIFDRAGTQPCVVNISLGTNGGPHDGTTLVDQGMDSLLQSAPNRAVTISAGNAFDDGIHAAGTVAQDQEFDLQWEVLQTLSREIEMEIWYAGADRLTVELIGPNNVSLATVAPGSSQTLTAGGVVAVFIANRLDDPNNHDNMIGIFLSDGMPGGTYTIRLRGDQVTNGQFHAWIERDNSFQSRFPPPHDNTHTIGSISCGQKVIAVGSYDAHKTMKPLSFFSSAGPTRDGREKPEVSAPGHAVLAARSGTGAGSTLKSGTSMASPAVAGLTALVLAEVRARGHDLSADEIRDIVIGSARRNPPAGNAWHDRYGHGRVSANAAVQQAMDLAGGGQPVPAAASRSSAAKKKKSARSRKSSRKSSKK